MSFCTYNSTNQILGNVEFWSGGVTGLGSWTNALGGGWVMRELHAMTNNVNICRVWMKGRR